MSQVFSLINELHTVQGFLTYFSPFQNYFAVKPVKMKLYQADTRGNVTLKNAKSSLLF